jgi:hypothetical protein
MDITAHEEAGGEEKEARQYRILDNHAGLE